MHQEIENAIKSTFELKRHEGEDKVLPLAEAVRQGIRPGMNIHVSPIANALLCQIMRAFSGTKPQFTLTVNAVGGYVINMVSQDLVSKLITSNCSFFYPTPGPVPLVQQAYKKGEIIIESWSTLTLLQRLMASALGFSCMPTRSMLGTTAMEENHQDAKAIEDPFDSSQPLAVVRALAPDVALIHGCVADRYGNTILASPLSEGMWAPAASKNGAIVTVERLVSTEYIREHPNLVHIPGYMVRSVSVVPFGAHPMGATCEGLDDFEGYAVDYDFLTSQRDAAKSREELNAWTKQWIIDCEDWEDYLRMLGMDRVRRLKGNRDRDIWRHELASVADKIALNTPPSHVEKMVVVAGCKIREKVLQSGCRLILAGIGASALAAWLAYYTLKDEGYGIDMMEGFGLMGHAPRPACPVFAHVSNIRTAKMLPDIGVSYGIEIAGGHNQCLSALGAAQIDKFGNINTSRIGDLYLIGPGGLTDAANAREVVIISRQGKRRFVENVSYVTCPGKNIKTMVTDMGIFEKLGGEEFILTGYLPDGDGTAEDAVRRVKENCGWDLKVAPNIAAVKSPSSEELMIIRLLDPQGFYLKD